MSEEAKQQSEFMKVMGLYKGTGSRGPYIAGKSGMDFLIKAGEKIYLFRNERKVQPNHPDYNLCVRRTADGKKE